MTKGDMYTKEILKRILEEGCLDVNPRPHYADGTPAHTLSVNHGMCTYDLTKGENPLITLSKVSSICQFLNNGDEVKPISFSLLLGRLLVARHLLIELFSHFTDG